MLFKEHPVPPPRQICPLAAPRQRLIERNPDVAVEFQKSLVVAGDTIVPVVPHQFLVQKFYCIGWLTMDVLFKPLPYVLLLGFQLLFAGAVQYRVFPRQRFSIDMGKSQKVKGVCLAVCTVLLRKSAEPDYLALVLRQLQIEFLQPCIQRCIESICLVLILEHADKVSSPGEFHPEALSEPDLNLLAHPAPIIQPQSAAAFCPLAPPLRLTIVQNRIIQPLRSTPITELHHYYGLFRPCPPHWYFRPCGSSAWSFPLASEGRFPRS